ncbi:hypothetical protein [Butyrivibrio sp. AE3004]|uniref:hypothetical protein n=1 Tax=Butyrivibrio sp. AE3004 TaxID=1506994 RepID=UPI0004940D79|nr:hypothetical protein [Butyrivibrio sp. AE3004]
MRDRRDYIRIEIDNNVLIFLDGCNAEIKGTVTDMSEESIGLNFPLTEDIKGLVNDLKTIQFQFVDSYTENGKNKTDIIQACALITRVEIKDGRCIIGGVVRDESYKRYVIHRKIAMYYR